MQRLSRECGCMLLILAAVVNVAVGGGKVPYYPRVCVGEKPDQCCQTRANIDFQASEYYDIYIRHLLARTHRRTAER